MTDRHLALKKLTRILRTHGIALSVSGDRLRFTSGEKQIEFNLAGEGFDYNSQGDKPFIALDYLFTAPEKVAAMVLSRLRLNRVVYARNCKVEKISREESESFIDRYHLMNATSSGSNLGLFHNGELLAVASFSKGRRMNRLRADQRSYELIRYCCKAGISVSGGLSRLLRHFVREKQPGDLMTYVDRQWSEGASFQKVGFIVVDETPGRFFLVDRNNMQRQPWKTEKQPYDRLHYYLAQSPGNLKMIYTPIYERI